MNDLHFIVPAGIDDPARPSGGNTYDRRISAGLAAAGRPVHLHPVPGPWPHPDGAAIGELRRTVATVPAGALVLVDGLIGSAAPDVLVPEAHRLRLIVLVHLPLETGSEQAVLAAAAAVIATSSWSRGRLLDRHALDPARIHVATPGVDAAELARGTAGGGELLCVAAVTPHKGHAELFVALAALAHLPWCLACIGATDLDRAFVAQVQRQLDADRIADRVSFRGPRSTDELDRAYAAADLLVLASRTEAYGMVVTEALARGLPVLATAVGGVPEALGRAPDGRRPGVLVEPDDPPALTKALDAWLTDAALREQLRHAARDRRPTLSGWSATVDQITPVLDRMASR